eukprot:CAMPEP_0173436876 /NCGR_PEP_ID=MMETSP1357-20121228/17489_1 /TAXON_ID=77926 /ORGANISM="Hemiselmis rufescens, Strain PCC563" /LENGTH=134 /DNA_ID=CAMNT_0014402027 /DNA_START=82 /DNA_END=482 /DNA_ORIENTATION=-
MHAPLRPAAMRSTCTSAAGQRVQGMAHGDSLSTWDATLLASSSLLTVYTLEKPSLAVGGSSSLAWLCTAFLPPPLGIVGWPSRAATLPLQTSSPTSKYTQTQCLGACMASPSHSSLSLAAQLHLSSTTQVPAPP